MRHAGAQASSVLAASIGLRLADALSAAHEARGPKNEPLGVVHRDVSPDNVLLRVDGAVKLTDFGIAKARSRGNHTTTGVLKGKVPYMAPEYAAGQACDARSDLYSLGVVLYELLAGARPFVGPHDAALLQQILEADAPRRFPRPFRRSNSQSVIDRIALQGSVEALARCGVTLGAASNAWLARRTVGEEQRRAEVAAAVSLCGESASRFGKGRFVGSAGAVGRHGAFVAAGARNGRSLAHSRGHVANAPARRRPGSRRCPASRNGGIARGPATPPCHRVTSAEPCGVSRADGAARLAQPSGSRYPRAPTPRLPRLRRPMRRRLPSPQQRLPRHPPNPKFPCPHTSQTFPRLQLLRLRSDVRPTTRSTPSDPRRPARARPMTSSTRTASRGVETGPHRHRGVALCPCSPSRRCRMPAHGARRRRRA